MANYVKSMEQFLTMSRDNVFKKFSDWAGNKAIDRGTGDEHFLYIPGTRKDRVVLVAHADTVFNLETDIIKLAYDESRQMFFSDSPKTGIGADDRAGCAILWELKNIGHSILIIGCEEKGLTSPWLMKEHKDIADELNKHQFVVQFDRCNATDYKCYNVGSDEFRGYVEDEMLGFSEPNKYSYTDIKTLCRDICGVNLSVGYYNEHTSYEYLLMGWWKNTLNMARKWLTKKNLPYFKLEKEVYKEFDWDEWKSKYSDYDDYHDKKVVTPEKYHFDNDDEKTIVIPKEDTTVDDDIRKAEYYSDMFPPELEEHTKDNFDDIEFFEHNKFDDEDDLDSRKKKDKGVMDRTDEDEEKFIF